MALCALVFVGADPDKYSATFLTRWRVLDPIMDVGLPRLLAFLDVWREDSLAHVFQLLFSPIVLAAVQETARRGANVASQRREN